MSIVRNILDRPYSDRRLILFVDDEVIEAYEKAEDAVAENRQFTLTAEAYLEYFKVRLKHLYIDDQIRILGLIRMYFLAKRDGVDVKLVDKNNIKLFQLPPGHPRDGVIYVGHPAIPRYYLPIPDFHRTVFEHKYSEVISMLMNLGAKNVRVKYMKGWGLDFLLNLNSCSLPLPSKPAAPPPPPTPSLPPVEVVREVTGRSLLDAIKNKLNSPTGMTAPAMAAPSQPPPPVAAERETAAANSADDEAVQCQVEQVVLLRTTAPAATIQMPPNMAWYKFEPTWQWVCEGRMKFGLKEFILDLNYREDFDINPVLIAKLERAGFHLGGEFERHAPTMWRIFGEFWVE